MRGQWRLFVDQFGKCVGARTVRELREKAGGGSVAKMYREKRDGPDVHCGYVVGGRNNGRWFTAYVPWERRA
tara:strand:- start:97 stop:312 length:216 start_codon:yes stop_codon:yes gene_type:complete